MVNINAQQYLDEKYPKEKRNKITELDIGGKNLEGELNLSDFTNLEKLDCSSNHYLTSLQLNNNSKLKSVKCDWNKLSQLVINNCCGLERLDCSRNELTELDLSKCSGLQNLNCSCNKLKKLELRGLTKLRVLSCQENHLTELNADKLKKLTQLECYNNLISQQEFRRLKASVAKNCPSLERKSTQLTSNAQEYLDWTYPKEARKDITWLSIYNKSLEGALKLEGFTKLENLHCYGNQLISLEVIDSPKLYEVFCSGNKLTKLNFGKSKKLAHLGCENNQFVELDFSSYPNLYTLNCENNLLTSLNLDQNWKLLNLKINNNSFSKQDLSFLSHLFNLTSLESDNNKFVGSLKPLQVMIRLGLLSIRDTDIDSGLEYLPKSITQFDCSIHRRPEAKIKILEQELKKHGESRKPEDSSYYRNYSHMYVSNNFFSPLEAWRDVNREKKELAYQEALQELLKIKKVRLSQKKKELVDFGKEAKKQLSQLLSKGKRTQELSREHEEWKKELKDQIAELERGISEVAKIQQELNTDQQQVQVEQPSK